MQAPNFCKSQKRRKYMESYEIENLMKYYDYRLPEVLFKDIKNCPQVACTYLPLNCKRTIWLTDVNRYYDIWII